MSASLIPRISSPKQRCCSFPICLISIPPTSNIHFSNSIPQLGIYKISTWNGLRQLDVPTSRCVVKIERKKRCKGVYASLFGVGAPEALVIGVVALLVFGPKGLAEVARNLGKTLRDFQPTIRELQEVSRDFKSTLEREIGLDEIQETTKPTPNTRPTAKPEDFVKANMPNANSAENKSYTSEEYLMTSTEQLRRQREKEADESQPKQQEDGSPTSMEASLGGEDMKIEQVEASAAELQVSDGSVFSKEAETQEYLKQLEEQVQALLAEKQRISSPPVAEVKPQDTSSFSTEASFTEDNVKSTEQGLEELAAQPHEETPPPTESQDEPQSQSEGTEGSWTSKETETQEYLKKLEEEAQELFAEKQTQTVNTAAEVKPEDTHEATSVSSPSQEL
ncbi:hypothetical protein Leryth_009866 [Lithospermum erythrorhizon]|nr:hypothetical protein Leryth_009866 [Lithospermum erythrorhizon]